LQFKTRAESWVSAATVDFASLDFPSQASAPVVVAGAKAWAAAARDDAFNSLLAVFNSEDEIRAIQPNFERVAASARGLSS
jgi:hypothetical protein